MLFKRLAFWVGLEIMSQAWATEVPGWGKSGMISIVPSGSFGLDAAIFAVARAIGNGNADQSLVLPPVQLATGETGEEREEGSR